jgi:beta-N-acetylhexosaminidase
VKPRYAMACLCAACLVALLSTLAAPGCGGPNGDPDSATASGVAAEGAGGGTTTATFPSTTVPTVPTTIPTTTTTLSPEEEILDGMTLRQKAAQVLLLGFEGSTLAPATRELLEAGPPGGLLLLGYNVKGAGQLRSLTAALQEAAAATGSAGGLLIAVDQEGGEVQRISEGVPDLPSARTLGVKSSVAEAERLAAETAVGLLDLGVNMNLAPVADVVSDPDSFLYPRTYGGDPATVSQYVQGVTKAFVENGLIAVVKHFPGHGSAAGNTHGGMVVSDAPKTEFMQVHLPPFRAAIAAGAECVMVAHIVAGAYDPDSPASLSVPVVTGLLREDLGFSGVVMTDDLEMAAVSGPGSGQGPDVSDAAVSALNAGCDLLISTGTLTRHKAMIDSIVQAVQAGNLAQDRLEEAVLRVLSLKLRHGIVAP